VARRRALLSIAIALATARCSLANPLDHLQGGRDPDASPTTISSEAGEPAGCPPERWSACGVTLLYEGGVPTRLTANGLHRRVFFSAGDTIFEVRCTGGTCTPPWVWATGEDPVRFLSIEWNWLYWITGDRVRRILVGGSRDAGAPAETVASVSDPTALFGDAPISVWSDVAGISGTRAGDADGGVYRYTTVRASTLLSVSSQLFYVAGGELFTCRYGSNDISVCNGTTVLDAGRGAELLARASDPSSPDAGGLIASVPRDGGTALVLVEQPGTLLAEEPAGVQALAAFGKDIYYTTKSGELRRRTLDVPNIVTVLRGLGAGTALAAGEREVFVAAPERRAILHIKN
jgi:hypothetical protein